MEEKKNWHKPVPKSLKALINKKHRLWSRYQETRQRRVELEYKHVRNIVKNEARKLERKEQLIRL